MSVLPTPSAPLPEAGRAGAAGRPSEPARHAWQREMERAQAETWFKHAPREGDPHESPAAVPAAPPPAALPPTDRTVMPPQPVFSWPAPPTPPGEPLPSGVPGEALPLPHLPIDAHTARQPAAPAFPTVPAAATPRSAVPSSTSTQPAIGSGTPARPTALLTWDPALPPVRVHLQWEGGTARVWVAADAAHAAHLPQLARLVTRWLAEQGIRVASLTCNGEAWAPDASAFASRRPAADAILDIHPTKF